MTLTRVTSTVVETGAITEQKLGNATITNRVIASGAITADKLAANVISAGPIAANINIVQDNVTALTTNVDIVQDNVAVITDATTNVNIGSGKYFFQKDITSFGINNAAPIAGTVSLGTPSNIILSYQNTTGGNVLIGDNLIDRTSPYRLDVRGTANTGIFRATSIGIGTAPSRPLTIESGETEQIRLINTHNGGDIYIEYRNMFGTDTHWFGGLEESDGSFRFNFKEADISSGEDSYVVIKKTMQVGIGTASPSANLHVVGTGKFTEQVNIDDDLVVTGNLTIHGDSSTVNAQNSTFSDQFIALASNLAYDAAVTADQGVFINRGTAGNALIYYDQSATGFKLAETRDPYSNVNIKPTHAANLHLANAFAETIKLNGADLATMISDNRSGAVSSVYATNLTASRALASDGSGKIAVSAVTATELGYLDGVSSAIQTQMDTKITIANSAANDFITYALLNANLNVIQDNVAALGGSVQLLPWVNANVQAASVTANTFFIGKAMPGDSLQNVSYVMLDGVVQTKDVPAGTYSSNNDYIVNAVAAHASIKFTAPTIPVGSKVSISVFYS